MHIALVFRDIVKVYSNVSTETTSVANKAFVLFCRRSCDIRLRIICCFSQCRWSIIQKYFQKLLSSLVLQSTKKALSDRPRLLDSVRHLPNGQVEFLEAFQRKFE